MRHHLLAALVTAPLITFGIGTGPATADSVPAPDVPAAVSAPVTLPAPAAVPAAPLPAPAAPLPAPAVPAVGSGAVHYAALGDSFASGSGAGNYDPFSGLCRRSGNSHPILWARSHRPDSFEYDACGGAVTEDVVKNQIPDALDDSTTVVTLTIGGNDADFESAIVKCVVVDSDPDECNRVLDRSGRFIDQALPGKLAWTYGAISESAPQAKVFVTGYPHLFELGRSLGCGVAEWRRQRMNLLVDHLNTVIKEQAEKSGFRYVDVSAAFAGHGVCAPGGIQREWVNRIVPTDAWQSYHPNKRGQYWGYLPAVTTAIG